jgi:hypothetical protein
MSLEKLEEEHNKKIQLYENKIAKYELLIEKEIKAFKPTMKKIEKQKHDSYINGLIKKCKKSYVIMQDCDDLEHLRKSDVQILPIEVYVEFSGSHALDNDHHLKQNSLDIDTSYTKNVKCDIFDYSDILSNYLCEIDKEILMDKLQYDYDSLCYGTWAGTIELYVVGNFKKSK